MEFHEEEALNATLPQKVICKIVETEPVVKGQTAANSFKPAVLDNGVKVMVPPFVGQTRTSWSILKRWNMPSAPKAFMRLAGGIAALARNETCKTISSLVRI